MRILPTAPILIDLPRRLVLLSLTATVICSTVVQAQSSVQPAPAATEKLEAVFDVGIVYWPQPREYGRTELMNAAVEGNATKVRTLIHTGADVNAVDNSGSTALISAAWYGHIDVVNQLLAAGADPEPISNVGRNALNVAVLQKETAVALALLRHGASANAYMNANQPERRSSVLERAAITGQSDVVAALIERGADLEVNGPAALNKALGRGHTDIAAALIVGGVDVNAPFIVPDDVRYLRTGETALQTAAQGGHAGTVELLLRHGADVNATDRRGQTALHYATRGGHLPVAKLLLANGASVSAENLSAALGAKNSELARTLIDSLILPDLSSAEFESLIAVADRAGEDAIITALFGARALLQPEAEPPRLLFARGAVEHCELILWNPRKKTENVVYTEEGECTSQYFVSDKTHSLFVVSNGNVRTISLNGDKDEETVMLPMQQFDTNLAALKIQVRETYGDNVGNAEEWMAADIVQVGRLESGELALVTHTGGPASETYGYVYARYGDQWKMIYHTECHRFDSCRFSQVLGYSLNARPSNLTIWHPNLRMNPYFQSKTTEPAPMGEYDIWNGTVLLDIDGQKSVIHYSTYKSGHCAGNCVSTRGLRLQLPGKDEQVLANYISNNSIVDRYALVRTKPRGYSELFSLATGESVFGKLQLAGWVH